MGTGEKWAEKGRGMGTVRLRMGWIWKIGLQFRFGFYGLIEMAT